MKMCLNLYLVDFKKVRPGMRFEEVGDFNDGTKVFVLVVSRPGSSVQMFEEL